MATLILTAMWCIAALLGIGNPKFVEYLKSALIIVWMVVLLLSVMGNKDTDENLEPSYPRWFVVLFPLITALFFASNTIRASVPLLFLVRQLRGV